MQREKDDEDDNGLEAYVRAKIRNHETTWYGQFEPKCHAANVIIVQVSGCTCALFGDKTTKGEGWYSRAD